MDKALVILKSGGCAALKYCEDRGQTRPCVNATKWYWKEEKKKKKLCGVQARFRVSIKGRHRRYAFEIQRGDLLEF